MWRDGLHLAKCQQNGPSYNGIFSRTAFLQTRLIVFLLYEIFFFAARFCSNMISVLEAQPMPLIILNKTEKAFL